MDIVSYLLGKNASGGGTPTGDIVIEEGTYTPSEDKKTDTINFKKTHEKAPSFVCICDTSGTGQEMYSMIMQYVINIEEMFGIGYPGTQDSLYIGLTGGCYTSSSVNTQKETNEIIYRTTANNKYYLGYWLTNTGFNLKNIYSGAYWKSNRTYKWIAIWK